MTGARTRLAVLGSPIAHSRSPQLHLAAYRELGLDWSYERIEVAEGGLASFVGGLDDGWRGLSVTMPLKAEAHALADRLDPIAVETGAVNTLRLDDGGIGGWNTDVLGIVRALEEAGIAELDGVLVLGAGATARSVASAARRLGARRLRVVARRPAQAGEVAAYAAGLGLAASAHGTDALPREAPDLVVNTIPGGGAAALDLGGGLRAAPLLEIAYDPWPSPLVARWQGPVVSGLEMLLWQAVAQVRAFTSGDVDLRLPGERAVVAAMRRAVAA